MIYPKRDDEFDGTEYESTIADLRDEVDNLMEELRGEREQCERHEAHIEDLRADLRDEEELARDAENRLTDAHSLLDGILEDVSSELLAHDRGSRTPEEAWELLRDIAARIREGA